jgi:hypothetical protein
VKGQLRPFFLTSPVFLTLSYNHMIPNDPSDKLNQNQGDISIPWRSESRAIRPSIACRWDSDYFREHLSDLLSTCSLSRIRSSQRYMPGLERYPGYTLHPDPDPNMGRSPYLKYLRTYTTRYRTQSHERLLVHGACICDLHRISFFHTMPVKTADCRLHHRFCGMEMSSPTPLFANSLTPM